MGRLCPEGGALAARALPLSLVALLAATATPRDCPGQGLVTPSSHWGSILLPDPDARFDVGLHFIGFTEYGKELIPGTKRFTFRPYNDIRETLGFNIVSFSRTAPRARFPLTESSVQKRNTLALGIVHDKFIEFLQNDLAHEANFRKDDPLDRIPRRLTDTPRSTTHAGGKKMPIAQFSQEFFFRQQERERLAATEMQRQSAFFYGGGYTVGTINQEVFLHIGTNPIGWEYPGGARCLLKTCLLRLGVGGIARGGVASPGHHLRDLTTSYANAQGIAQLAFSVVGFPVQLETSVTGAQGFFAERRTRQDSIEVIERDQAAEGIYSLKRPKHERFEAHRLRIGDFTFEYVNDEPGGKDKGPSFGVATTLNISRTRGRMCEVRSYMEEGTGRADGRRPWRWLKLGWRRFTCSL